MPETLDFIGFSGILQLYIFYFYLHYLTVYDENLKSLGGNTVPVQVRSPAPNQKNPNQNFPIGKGFGFFVYI